MSALLSEYPHAWGVGVERDGTAAQVAKRNLQRLELASRGSIVVADWTAPLNGKFDLIVTNPPYIPAAEIASLQTEVAKFEPNLALNGGVDGLDAYREIFPSVGSLLAHDGILVAEFGNGQVDPVILLAEAMGMVRREVHNDLAGRARCLVLGR